MSVASRGYIFIFKIQEDRRSPVRILTAGSTGEKEEPEEAQEAEAASHGERPLSWHHTTTRF